MASLPNAPNITIRPDARDQALKFFWSAPTPNGSPPVLSYQLTDGTNTVSLPAAATFYTYSGLTNGTSYTFRIAASNANGLGPYAFYRTVQPGLTPGTPALSTVISSVGSLNYTVGWSNPSDLGGATGLLGTLLTAVPIDSNGNLNMTSSLWIQTTVLGGNSNAFQQAVVQLTSNYNYRINIQPVVDAGYSRIPVYTSTISSSFVAQPVFTPSTIQGMQLWLDGADSTSLTLSTSNVTQWNDKSGNAKNFSNTTGSARPVYNSTLSSLFFNNSLLDGAQIISTNQRNIHFFGVWSVSTTTGATFQAVFEQNVLTASNGYRFMVYGSPFSGRSGNFYGLNGYGTNPTPVDGFPTFTVNSTMMSYIGANSDGTTFTVTNRHNGSLYSTQTISQANMNVAAATTRFGRRVGGTEEPYFGRMSEVLLYSSILSANQYATLEGYLAWKWGLSTLLPSTHPFYSRAPLVTDSNIDFSPSSIGTMRLWLDAADVGTISTSGSSVLRWADKSGSNNHASGGTSPSFTSSNLGVIFNGSQVLNLPDGTLPINDTDYSIFFNVSASNVTSGIWWLSQGTTNSNVLGSPIYNGAVWHSWGTAGEISSLALTNNIPFIASMTYTSGTRLLIKDGIWNNGDAKTGRATTAGNARLGKSEQNAQFFTGKVL